MGSGHFYWCGASGFGVMGWGGMGEEATIGIKFAEGGLKIDFVLDEQVGREGRGKSGGDKVMSGKELMEGSTKRATRWGQEKMG